MERAQFRDMTLLALIPVIAFAGFAYFHGSVPFVTPDSPSYMYFGEDRPVGYPLFLAFIRMFFGSLQAVRTVQLGIICVSLMCLAWSFRLSLGSLWTALGLEILLFANPGLLFLSQQIMADSLAASCLTLFAALVLLMMNSPREWMVWSMAGLTAIAILVRPVNIALVPATLATFIIFGRPLYVARWIQVLILAIAIVGAYEATPLTHWLRHEPLVASNPLARGLLQKTLFHQWLADPAADACDGALISEDTSAINEYLAQTPEDIRPYLLPFLSGYLRFMVIMPEMLAVHHAQRFSDIDPILMCYDKARFEADPLYFVMNAAHQFRDLLTYSTFVSPAKHDEIDAFLASHPPVLPRAIPRHDVDYRLRAFAVNELNLDPDVFQSIDLYMSLPHARSLILSLAFRSFQIAGAVAMGFGLLTLLAWFLTQRSNDNDRTWLASGILGLAFYGVMMLTAIVEIALPRFVFPLWPFFCVAITLAVVSARLHLWRRV